MALADAAKAVKIKPGNIYARLLLGRIYKINGSYEKALHEFKKAKELAPDKPDILIDLAFIYEKMGKYGLSIQELNNAMQIGCNNEYIHLNLARIYCKKEEYTLAIQEYAIIAETNPSSSVLGELISIYRKLNKLDLSIETSSKYLDIKELSDRKNNLEIINVFQSLGKEKNLNIKMLRTPHFIIKPKGELNYSSLLPLGMGQIVSYLRSNGFKIDQDDLYIKINYENMFCEEQGKIDTEVFFDKNRIMEYSAGKDDACIDALMEKAEAKSKLSGYGIVVLSIPEGYENSSGYLFALAYTRYIRKKYNPIIIIGGPRPAIEEIKKYNTENIDYIIEGNGEKALFKILAAIKYGVNFSNIPEIIVSDNGKLIEDKEFVFGVNPDFSGLPINLYEFKKPVKASGFGKEIDNELNDFFKSKILMAPYVLMWGCLYECIFCGSSSSKTVLFLSPGKAVENLRSLKENYGINNFLFLNNSINISKKYVNEFCDELINAKLDILWCDCARADYIDKATLVKLRKAGCIRLIYGMETASPRLLKYIDKKINLTHLEDVLSWTNEAGIWTGVEQITGFPHETDEDMKMTIDFLNRNEKNIDTVYYNMLFLHKQSKLYLNPRKYGIENIDGVNYQKSPYAEFANVKCGYDEIGGLKWEAKIQQMMKRYEFVFKNTGKDNFFHPFFEMEHFLFYLYAKYKDKNKVLSVYNSVKNALGSFIGC